MGYGFGRNQFNRTNANQQQQAQIRTRLSLGFTPSGAAPALVAQRFEGRLAKTSHIEAITPVKVTMEGSTAILQGTVASEHQRDLARRLAMLEPGISDVRNELTVRRAAPAPEPTSAPSSTP
jgi:osmotically-inducible protein OsmY